MSRYRCTRCWAGVAPSEASCAGCGAQFSPEQIRKATEDEPRLCPENRDKICGECGPDECRRESA